MKLLCVCVYPREGPSVRHRILSYQPMFAKAGVTLVIWPLLTAGLYRRRRRFGFLATVYKACMFCFCTARLIVRLPAIRAYDAVIIHREAYPIGPPLFEKVIKRLCKRVFFDVDDALWESMPLKIDQRGRWHHPERFDEIMRGCEAVVVGNDTLRARAARVNPRVTVIPTPYRDLGGPSPRPGNTDRPIIVWIGNVGNEEYLDMLRDPLRRLAVAYPFRFRIIGSVDTLSYAVDGVDIEARLWSEPEEGPLLLGSDIGVMPLLDRSYERGKCAFKLVQYFSAGLPVVASPVGMNKQIIDHGRNGYLAHDPNAWYDCLASLLSDPERRSALGRAGYETYRNAFTPEINAARWLSLLTATI